MGQLHLAGWLRLGLVQHPARQPHGIHALRHPRCAEEADLGLRHGSGRRWHGQRDSQREDRDYRDWLLDESADERGLSLWLEGDAALTWRHAYPGPIAA